MTKKLIFVGGIPRSGTTLVQNVLDSHPEISGGPEFDRIPNIVDLRNRLVQSAKVGRIDYYVDQSKIDRLVANFISGLLEHDHLDRQTTLISEKTPWNILYFMELAKLFPQAKLIMILRNPLDVYSSMKTVARRASKKGIKPPDYTTDVKLAVAYMEAAYKLMEACHKRPERFMLLRFEELLKDLEKQARGLCQFLEVEWSPSMLEFDRLSHPGQDQMTKDQVWYTDKQFSAKVQKGQGNASKQKLSGYERAFIKYMFRKNSFVNANNQYFKGLSFLERLVGKLMFLDYRKHYQFKQIPKRILP